MLTVCTTTKLLSRSLWQHGLLVISSLRLPGYQHEMCIFICDVCRRRSNLVHDQWLDNTEACSAKDLMFVEGVPISLWPVTCQDRSMFSKRLDNVSLLTVSYVLDKDATDGEQRNIIKSFAEHASVLSSHWSWTRLERLLQTSQMKIHTPWWQIARQNYRVSLTTWDHTMLLATRHKRMHPALRLYESYDWAPKTHQWKFRKCDLQTSTVTQGHWKCQLHEA